MAEIDLLKRYPRSKRNVAGRNATKTPEHKKIAKKFDREFFDGDRDYGYGGFTYDPRFWTDVVKDVITHYDLAPDCRILDVGCAKGFMLFDFSLQLPHATLKGIDVSNYAIQHCKPEIAHCLSVADARQLPFEDNSFDLVMSVNTIHNLGKDGVRKALQEMSRVSANNCFLTVDAFRTNEEKESMFAWNLTAETILSVDEWKTFFHECDYFGDYYWFMP